MAKILIGNNDVYANKDGKTLVLNADAEVEIDEKQAAKFVSLGKATTKTEKVEEVAEVIEDEEAQPTKKTTAKK